VRINSGFFARRTDVLEPFPRRIAKREQRAVPYDGFWHSQLTERGSRKNPEFLGSVADAMAYA
jgi:hypothetical protein